MTLHKYTGTNDYYKDAGDEVLAPGDEVEFEEGPPEVFEDRFEPVETEEPADVGESESSTEEDESPSEDEESSHEGSEAGENSDEGEESEELSEPPIDPTSLTVSELESELEAGEFPDSELNAIEAAEASSEDPRATALEAIQSAQE